MFNSIPSTTAFILLLVLILVFNLSHINKSKKSLRLRSVDFVYDKYWGKIEPIFFKLDERTQKSLNNIYYDMVLELKAFEISKEDLNNYIKLNKAKLQKEGILRLFFTSLVIPIALYFLQNLSKVDKDFIENLLSFIKNLWSGNYETEIKVLLMVLILPLVIHIFVLIQFKQLLIKWNQKLPVLEDLYSYWDNVVLREVDFQNDNSTKKYFASEKLKIKDVFKFVGIFLVILFIVVFSAILIGFVMLKYPLYLISLEIILLFVYYLYIKQRR